MNSFTLVWAYLRYRPLNTVLNLLLMSVGVAMISVLLLIGTQLEQRLSQNAQGIDLVIGAKGSPLQLILSSIYHADVPTGNIPLAQVRKVVEHPLVKQGIPLALGDSYRGYRIVGTTVAYPLHYQAQLAAGRWWVQPLEAVLGAEAAQGLGLKIGDWFAGAHGLGDGGQVHAQHQYQIVGIMAATGTVLDRLVLTDVETVWRVHEHNAHETDETSDEHEHDHEHEEQTTGSGYLTSTDPDAALTAMLVQYRSPVAAVTLPRLINGQSALQAAVPAFEIARLLQLVGTGIEMLTAFGALLISIAALGMLIGLYYALQERRYDLALMRLLGASRGRVMRQLLLEGLLMALLGASVGLLLGHGLTEWLSQTVSQAAHFSFTGRIWLVQEWWLLGLAALTGIVAALIPALQAYRTDIANVLADAN